MVKFKALYEQSLEKDPFILFDNWFRKRMSSDLLYPGAFSLGTASADGRVSVRTVLLKGFDDRGFIFFTSYNSHKGKQLDQNPSAAMLFYWPELSRQVRIEGSVEKISREESQAYFDSRPRESRIGAWASNQGKKIPDREYLEKKFTEYADKFSGKPVPKPPYWGGYRIIPTRFEFWNEGKHRLHDRIVYTPYGDKWRIARLSP